MSLRKKLLVMAILVSTSTKGTGGKPNAGGKAMQLSTKNIARTKTLAEKQYNDFVNGEPTDSMVGFVFCDTFIINPFVSQNGIEDVDPIEYYGESFLQSEFCTMEVE